MIQRVGMYNKKECDFDHLVDIMRIDTASYLIDRLSAPSVILNQLKGSLLDGDKVFLNFNYPQNTYLKVFEKVTDKKFYISYEECLITLSGIRGNQTDNNPSNAFVNLKETIYRVLYEDLTEEGLERNSKVFWQHSFNDLIVLWLKKGMYNNFQTAVLDSCSGINGFLTSIAKTLRDKPDIFSLSLAPKYTIVGIQPNQYLIELGNNNFHFKKRVEVNK